MATWDENWSMPASTSSTMMITTDDSTQASPYSYTELTMSSMPSTPAETITTTASQASDSPMPMDTSAFVDDDSQTATTSTATTMTTIQNSNDTKPKLRFREPPTRVQRLRYRSEGLGSIKGINSTHGRKTLPVVEIVGGGTNGQSKYAGSVELIVSCVSASAPYRPHPHQLASRDTTCQRCGTRARVSSIATACRTDGAPCQFVGNCVFGFFYAHLTTETLANALAGVGLQSVKRSEVRQSVANLRNYNIDPFNYYKRCSQSGDDNFDLKKFRLCFQAFINYNGNTRYGLPPLLSDVIHANDLVVRRICCCAATVNGGDEIMLLGANLPRELRVKFYELDNETGYEVWTKLVTPIEVYRSVVVRFKTPPYHSEQLRENAKTYLRLVRNSDGAESTALDFEYIPIVANNRREAAALIRRQQQPEQAIPAANEVSPDEVLNSLLYLIDNLPPN